MSKVKIGTVDEFPEGSGRMADADGIPVAVFNVDGELYAIQNTCIHKNLPLHPAGQPRFESAELQAERSERREAAECPCGDGDASADVEGDVDDDCDGERISQRTRGRINEEKLTIHCPWHYLEWDLETGENPVQDRRIATFDVEVDDRDVLVEL